MLGSGIVTLALFLVVVIVIAKAIRVVPQQHALVIERWGRFHAVLAPGLNFVVPFVDRVAYKHDLREIPFDVPSQICITKDNTQLQVDGILYFQVTDPKLASYGSSNFMVAITQLAQTTLRSVIGKMELDRTFEERDHINGLVVAALDQGGQQLGRQGVALRDQGPHAAQGNTARHAGADHRRARKARRHRDLRGPAAGADQSRRRSARRCDCAVRGRQAGGDQHRAGPGCRDSVDRRGEREGDPAGRGSHRFARRRQRRQPQGGPSSTWLRSATWRRPTTRSSSPSNLSDLAGLVATATTVSRHRRNSAWSEGALRFWSPAPHPDWARRAQRMIVSGGGRALLRTSARRAASRSQGIWVHRRAS